MEQHSRLPSGDFPYLRASRTNMGLLIHVSTQAFFRTFADWVNPLYNTFTLKQEVSNMEIAYVKCGDYYIPDLTLPEELRPMGKWGRMHREYLKATHPITYTNLILSGKLWTYLADLNEQAQLRLDTLVSQMKAAEGITEALKARDPMQWVQRMNSIRDRAEEILREELIYV